MKMSTAKVACYLETANVRVCAHTPIESLLILIIALGVLLNAIALGVFLNSICN